MKMICRQYVQKTALKYAKKEISVIKWLMSLFHEIVILTVLLANPPIYEFPPQWFHSLHWCS